MSGDHAVNTTGNHVLLTGTGTQIVLMPAEVCAQSAHTVLSFRIENNLRAGDLEGRGVTFLDYNLPDLETTNHVAAFGTERGPWFSDMEGTSSPKKRILRAGRTDW